VATPAIGRELGGSAAGLNWVTNAFMLSFGSLLMAAGALADQFGRKRLFMIGVGLFTVTSVALSFAPSVLVIDILRAMQGMAAAAALAGGNAALAQEFEGDARARAFSLLGVAFGAGLAFGPLLAGFLAESFGWRSIFLSSACVGVLALLFGAPHMRETRDPNATGLDWRGALAFTALLTLFTFGLIQAPASGWASPTIVVLFVAAAALLLVFILVEIRAERPMLDLSLFRYPRFVGVQVLPIATCYCYVVLLVLLPLRFIGVEGLGAIEAGLLMIPLSIPMLVAPFLAVLLARWLSVGLISTVGLLIAAAGLFWLRGSTGTQGIHTAILPLLVIGLGTGLPWGLMDGLSVSVVPKERAGMATGIFSTTRVAGEGIALAIVSAILSALTQLNLSRTLGQTTAAAPERIAEAAQRLAAGDLHHAIAVLPSASPLIIAQSYAAAFRGLLFVLVLITVLAALAIFVFLRHESSRASRTGVSSCLCIPKRKP
jgi:EmrB/QacA subfamily drug resistance transporter